jgi:hypothetical protein
VTLYRPYFYCRPCGFGFYPLDIALGLSPRKTQSDIQELEAWLAAEMPYETANETLERCAGIKLSNHHAHDVVNEIADDIQLLDVCPSKVEILHKIEALSEGKFRRPVLMIGIDGAHAPTRQEPSPREGWNPGFTSLPFGWFFFQPISGAPTSHPSNSINLIRLKKKFSKI